MNALERPMSSSSSSSSSSLSPSPVSALPPTPGPAAQRQLSHADKLRKVINELVETERTYVKVSVLSAVRAEGRARSLAFLHPSAIGSMRRPPLIEHRPCLCFQDLSCLIECYLTPLQKESFLTQDEVPLSFFFFPAQN